MRKLLEFSIRSHLHLAVFSFIYLLGLYDSVPNIFAYSFMFSLGILSMYNFHRLYKYRFDELPINVLNWVEANKLRIAIIAVLSCISTVVLYFSFFNQTTLIHVLSFLCVIVSVLYVYRVGKINLRQLPYIKIGLVMAIWFFLLHIMPFLILGVYFDALPGAILLFAILIPSDMKDLGFDPEKMKTLPQLLGIQSTIHLLRFLSFNGIILVWVTSVSYPLPWLISFGYLFLLTFFYKRIGKHYYFVWVDAAFLMTGLVFLLK